MILVVRQFDDFYLVSASEAGVRECRVWLDRPAALAGIEALLRRGRPLMPTRQRARFSLREDGLAEVRRNGEVLRVCCATPRRFIAWLEANL